MNSSDLIAEGNFFREAVSKYFSNAAKDEASGALGVKEAVWLDYTLSTNQRGSALLDKMTAEFVGPLDGKRVLDIGSGYGGVVINAARRGAEAIGIELSNTQITLAKENLRDFPGIDVSFLQSDVLELGIEKKLGIFDLVVCDNVIEHVDNADRLIYNISAMLKRDAVTYVTAPNAFSLDQVQAECHYQKFGISLMDRFDADRYFAELEPKFSYEVGDYFDYAHYVDVFESNGLSVMQLVPLDCDGDTIISLHRLAQNVQDMLPSVNGRVRELVEFYLHRFNLRLQEINQLSDGARKTTLARRFNRDYGLGLWYFVGKKTGGDDTTSVQ